MSHDFQLELSKGQQTPPEPGSIPHSIGELETWIENLPTANVGAMTQQFYERIYKLNAAEIAPDQRFEFLEALRVSHAHLHRGLSAKYRGIRFPLSEKKRQVAEINREMIHQMALGYKIIIQDHASGKTTVGHKLLLTAVERAIFYLGSSLLESYLVYAPVREMTWFEIHSLYRFAFHEDFHTKNVADEQNCDQCLTIEKLYIQFLIVAAIDPYRLPRGEAEAIFTEISSWTQHAKLSANRPENQPVGIYLIKLNSDMPPIHMSSVLAQPEGFSLYLDCTRLSGEIHKRVSSQEQSGLFSWRKPKNDVNKDALNNLMLALGAVGERVLRRTPTKASVTAIVGLTSIYQELAGPETTVQVTPTQRNTPLFQTHDIPSLSDKVESRVDVWSFSPGAKRPKSADNLFVEFPEQNIAPPAAPIEKILLQVVDVSSGGYCLSTDNSQSDKVQVGDLLTLRDTGQPESKWKIGSIQWIRQEKSGLLLLGVRVLHTSPLPVMVKVKKEDGYYSAPEKALLLPAVPACNQKQALLTDIMPFRTGVTVQMRHGGKVHNLVLDKLRVGTRFYVVHEFSSESRIEQNPQSSEPFNESRIKDLLASL